MNVIGMKHIRGQREVMHPYVRRERMWRLAAKGVVPMRGGRGRGGHTVLMAREHLRRKLLDHCMSPIW